LIADLGFWQNFVVDELPVRVAIVSPQPVVTSGLRAILTECECRVDVVPLNATGPDPDVVLYDVIGLLGGDGSDLDILIDKTASTVLAVTRGLRPDLGSQALARGAEGFFDIGADEAEICAAVHSTQTGWQPGDTGENPVVGSSESARFKDRVGSDLGLTPREREILALIAQGYSNLEIAGEIHLGVNTIKTHIRGRTARSVPPTAPRRSPGRSGTGCRRSSGRGRAAAGSSRYAGESAGRAGTSR